MQHDYRSEKEQLMNEREAILARTDLTESEKALLLEDLAKRLEELEVNHQQIIVSLDAQRKVSCSNSFMVISILLLKLLEFLLLPQLQLLLIVDFYYLF